MMASIHPGNLSAARARALAASTVRFLGGAFVSSELSRLREITVMASTAVRNAARLVIDGLLKPLILRTNWVDADRISASVAGGS